MNAFTLSAASIRRVVDETVRRSGETDGVSSRTFRIAGKTCRLLFTGRLLPEKLTPALSHLEAEDGPPPDLTVYIPENLHSLPEFSPAESPLPPSAEEETFFFEDSGLLGTFNRSKGALTFSVFDAASRTAVFFAGENGSLPAHDQAAPLRVIFYWWLREYGIHMIHAGALGLEGRGGVLIAGKSGSGKSNITLSCLGSGLAFGGDDYVLADAAGAIYGLYGSAKLSPADLVYFPGHRQKETATETPSGKKVLLLKEGLLTNSFPLKAVLIPAVTESKPALKKIPPAAALRDMAPSTILQLPGAGTGDFAAMTQLVMKVPCYRLETGRDCSDLPGLIRELIA